MSVVSKAFSLLLVGGISLVSITALGMTTTNTDELYADSINLQRSSAEVPTSINSETANAAALQEDYVVESVSDLEDAPKPSKAPKIGKKVSSAKTKKNTKN